ncbi:MAG: serine proteinase inhibitor [Clostridiales bacterium]|nr:serine proteinase inhibitor [Clostridiales bacterium]
MRKNTIKIIAAFLLLLLLSTACVPISDLDDKNSKNKTGDLTLESDITWPSAPDSIQENFRNSLLKFSWDLFQSSSENEGNVLISPASVYLALGMTYNGAEGDTRQAMSETLSAATMSPDEFNEACRDYISILRTMGDETELSIANSVWYRNEFPIAKDFLQTNANYFNATAQSLDFNDASAVKTINAWVDKATKGTIKKIVEEIQPENMMYLINAVYFKSDWKVPFDGTHTRKSNFNSANGKVNVDFMNRMGDMDYFEKDGTKGVVLPYDDGRFQFFAILPNENTDIRSFINTMDGVTIYNYLASINVETVMLSLPKFETNFSDSLNDDLSKMGMEIAFDPSKADFFSMIDKDKQGSLDRLFISNVQHKTFCRVDELGTEASAVTSVDMAAGGVMEPEKQLVFDRPFVYGIVDVVTEAPLFLGIMENPS